MDLNNCNAPDLSTQSRTSQVDRKDYYLNHLFDTNATPKTRMDLGRCHLPILYHYTEKLLSKVPRHTYKSRRHQSALMRGWV